MGGREPAVAEDRDVDVIVCLVGKRPEEPDRVSLGASGHARQEPEEVHPDADAAHRDASIASA